MRHPLGSLLRRPAVGAVSLAALFATCGAAAAPPSPEAESIAFTQRYRVLQHGGVVRAANSALTCRAGGSAKTSCPAARSGGAAANGDFDMTYTDVDRDPRTDNSSSAEVRLPAGAKVTYARLYWGGNLRAGERKPAGDSRRVLFQEPGGSHREVLADSLVGHRVAGGADAYQASADVTRLVRASGGGSYTVAQIDVAKGRSAAGACGGWTLVAAYEKRAEPLRRIALWDGFESFSEGHRGHTVRLGGMPVAAGATGRVGMVAYNGDRGVTGDSLSVSSGRRARPVALRNTANPADDVLNSSISEPGRAQPRRVPAYANTLGYDSDVFTLGRGTRQRGPGLDLRMISRRDTAWIGVLFAAVDAGP
ncbi:DUF3344 domain-containing protein [Streptomyces antnestii]|uniref:DUF3344 domain-containing protein n=1 Tax=Streptomyces antnestii TaxID=2494256 RepID=A0A437PZ27_9ACTN|nr:DUF3344 domain-containing protein [Streptomyces sp. San01]RVU27514.1 DUF3344 domain-containing protein [Streptomyces sp. San01]